MAVKRLQYWFLLLTTFILTYLGQYLNFPDRQLLGDNYFYSPDVFAQTQTITPEKVASEVYQKIPDFPLENNYTSRETNQTNPENTLISRLVRYHQYTKSRPTNFRLDWKLTLADYLGKNETINGDRYPGFSTLTQNPFEGDRKIIESLTMEQRNNLVNILVSIYNPNFDSKPTEKPSQNPQNNDSSPSFTLPKPGGADLLLP
jgi:hypothetical protein